MKRSKVLQITVIANLTALAVLFYFFPKFPLPFFPGFLEIQFSNLPAIIGGYALGPIAGGAIVVIRTLIKLPFSTTAYVGELVDLLIGLSTVLTSAYIYKRNRTLKGALLGMGVGTIVWVVVAVAANYFFVIDFYVEFFFNGAIEPLVGMASMIPGITAENFMSKYILYAAIPFNLLLSVIVYSVTFLVYKRISHFIDELAKRFQK
ncbi:Riboflavin transporter RibU [Candidatus Izimaplasma bacterium HR1]|jgi:riboflavin transporter FmnP|uniref:ECF transporter S component n=1 Tax=Candidatus Izimoplasma sp. HR1 TaxID=1541959 RepID=UPI0004F7C3F6|nr:Riboflavin transporter RibU [Candidatus Izimaplasma bacterium HR1]